MKKRLRAYVVISLLILSVSGLIGCSSTGDNDKETQKSEYAVTIDEAVQTIEDTLADNPRQLLMVTYTFTNNSNSEMTFSAATNDSAFQDNLQLEPTLNVDDSAFDIASTSTLADPGQSIKVTVAYELLSTTSPVEVKCLNDFSLDKEVLASKTFDLALIEKSESRVSWSLR
jgi:hypothetical protein